MKGRMYFDLFGHRDYNMMQPFFMVDPVLKQPLRGSRRPRSYIQCIQDSHRPLSSLLTPVGWTRPNISLARNEITLENLCTRTAQSSRGGHSRRVEKIVVFMCTLLLKNVINFLIFYF